MAILYNDRKEVIPMINSANLEYDLTSAIVRVIRKEMPTVGFTGGHGEPSAEEGANYINQLLKKEYLIENVDLTADISTLKNIKTIIVNGPKSAYTDLEQYSLDQYLMNGGNLLFLLDGVSVDNNLQGSKSSHGLFELLKSYGLILKPDLVVDAASGIAPFSSGYNTFYTPYPFWPKINKEGFNPENPLTKDLEAALFPWVSTIETVNQEGGIIIDLINTSPKSYIVENNFDLSPQQTYQFNSASLNKQRISAAVEGNIISFYKEKNKPKGLKSSSSFIGNTTEGKIILVGDADFVNDGILGSNQGNMILFLNMVDYLSQNSDLFSIRSKGFTDRPLMELTESQKNTLRYLNIFGPPTLVAGIGLVYRFIRRRNKYELPIS